MNHSQPTGLDPRRWPKVVSAALSPVIALWLVASVVSIAKEPPQAIARTTPAQPASAAVADAKVDLGPGIEPKVQLR